MHSVFADSWFVGKGLKQGDYFRYKVCYIEYNNCAPLEIDFWFQNQSLTSHDYFLQMLAMDGNSIQKGTVMTMPDTPIPVYSDKNISNYSNVYRYSILWLADTASFPTGKDFNSPLWSHNGVEGSGFGPMGQEKVTVQSDSYDAWIIGWANSTHNNGGAKIWVVPSMPFPVKGIKSTYSTQGISQLDFDFELLETGNSKTEPAYGLVYSSRTAPQSTSSDCSSKIIAQEQVLSNTTFQNKMIAIVRSSDVFLQTFGGTHFRLEYVHYDWSVDNQTCNVTLKDVNISYYLLPNCCSQNVVFTVDPELDRITTSMTHINSMDLNSTSLSPLKQFQYDVFGNEIKCDNGLVVVVKKSESSPACVTPDTAKKLVERGWAVSTLKTILFQSYHTPWFTRAAGMPSTTGFYIKNYFKEHQITILDANWDYRLTYSKECGIGIKNGTSYFFLVPESEADKMTKLGFTMTTLSPSYLHCLCRSVDYC